LPAAPDTQNLHRPPEREMMTAAAAMRGDKLPATKLDRAGRLRASSLAQRDHSRHAKASPHQPIENWLPLR